MTSVVLMSLVNLDRGIPASILLYTSLFAITFVAYISFSIIAVFEPFDVLNIFSGKALIKQICQFRCSNASRRIDFQQLHFFIFRYFLRHPPMALTPFLFLANSNTNSNSMICDLCIPKCSFSGLFSDVKFSIELS